MTNLPVAMRIAISLVVLALSAMFTIPAHADAVAEAKAVNDAFSKAFEACDVPAVMALYEDDAVLIWPGQGEFAIGKPAIEKVIKGYCSESCRSRRSRSSAATRARSAWTTSFIIGQLDTTIAGPDGKPVTMRIRTSELLHKSHGKWRYEVDHASAGLPPAGRCGCRQNPVAPLARRATATRRLWAGAASSAGPAARAIHPPPRQMGRGRGRRGDRIAHRRDVCVSLPRKPAVARCFPQCLDDPGRDGPVDPIKTNAGKLFASFYALYSGLAILSVAGLILAPVVHRFLHKFHVENDRD